MTYELICANDECDFRLTGDSPRIIDHPAVFEHPHPTRLRVYVEVELTEAN